MGRNLLKILTAENKNVTKYFNQQCLSLINLRNVSSKTFNGEKKFDENHLKKSRVRHFSTSFGQDKWSKILIKAEKVVGYPPSFLNLRYLVSDEVAHFAQLLRKLIQTKHPLIKMARKFIFSNDKAESKRSLQVNGLIVLLISKAVGLPSTNSLFNTEISDGIHNSQRCLAEIAEMIYMGTVIHRGILDLKMVDSSDVKNMDQGNKLAVLCGDYLLANACNNLAKLRNTEVVDLMSQVISDNAEGMFKKNSDLTFLKIWLENINSNSSSLLANSAKSSMVLVKHSQALQEVAYNFGMHLDITHKIWTELNNYKKDDEYLTKKNTLFNAIHNDKFQLKSLNNATNVEKNVSYSNDEQEVVLNECKLLFNYHYLLASEHLKSLAMNAENSDQTAVDSLKSILNVMKNTI